MTEIEHIRKCSQYLNILLRNNPDFEEFLLSEGNIKRKYPLANIYSALGSEVAEARCFNDLLRIFRRFKQRHFLRIGARDLCGYADLSETTGQLSDLATVALQVGLEVLSAHPGWWAGDRDSDIRLRLGARMPLVVLGLGKLGGHELNYVSDIDLIFLRSDAEKDGADGPEDSIMLLSRLVHRLSRLLSDPFEGDRVFHVDFRLRPQGKEGILAPSMSGAIEHYLLRGRAWERQMLLKCRPVAGERSEGNAFIREIRPFVFRRFLDFQALGELKEMRSRILSESARFKPGTRGFDVKLGIGGIREIEFFVQSMQLIYGGRRPELDEPNTLKCLEKLSGLGLLPQETAEEMKRSYTFLRNVEHYIQIDQNRHTQRLPRSWDERMRLVCAMGFGDDEAAFLRALEMRCSIVHSRFQELFREAREEKDRVKEETHPGVKMLSSFPSEPFEKLKETLDHFPVSMKSQILIETLEGFSHISDTEVLKKVLVRLDTYLGSVARRTGLKRLFEEAAHGAWLAPFCRAIASSKMVAALLSYNPSLVEGHALTSGIFMSAPRWLQSGIGLLQSTEEYGEKLERIRRLKNERIVQLALADLGGLLDFAALEGELTFLADFVIRSTLDTVRQNLRLPEGLPLSVLGMGKLGSMEMSYLSDLDLVFVYSPGVHEQDSRIPGEVIRLIQRFMNMLSMPLQEGPGYPMDVRLRPTGTHGPLVVTRKSWLEYYQAWADIWEIQALLRIRHIAGDLELGRWIEERAAEICFRKRPVESVWPRICHLRKRMERERAAETEDEIDLKLGMGGLADIEFIAQGRLLVGDFLPDFLPKEKGEKRTLMGGDRQNPGKAKPGDERVEAKRGNQEAAELGEGIVPAPVHALHRSVRRLVQKFSKDASKTGSGKRDSHKLNAAFGALRALDHRVRLHTDSSDAKLDENRFEEMVLLGLWPPGFDGGAIGTWQDILRLRREIRGIFKRFCP
jgi:glutamate-ammonia-ligase adenylyltransferase